MQLKETDRRGAALESSTGEHGRTVRRLAVAVTVAAQIGLGANVAGAQDAGAGLAEYQENGLVVGVANLPPYSSINERGEIVGVAPAVVKTVLSGIGIEVTEGHTATYSSLIPGLDAGRWDMVAASMSMTAERCPQVLFSNPILVTTTSMAVTDGKTQYASLDELRESGASVGVQQGTHLLTDGVFDDFTADVITYPDVFSAIDAMKVGRVDVVVNSTHSLQKLPEAIQAGIEISPALTGFPRNPSGVAFRLDQPELRDAFNAELDRLKGNSAHDTVLAEYGFEFPDDMRALTAEEWCSREH